MVGQEGQKFFEKGTCTDYDVIMTSEIEFKGYFSQPLNSISALSPTIVAVHGKS